MMTRQEAITVISISAIQFHDGKPVDDIVDETVLKQLWKHGDVVDVQAEDSAHEIIDWQR